MDTLWLVGPLGTGRGRVTSGFQALKRAASAPERSNVVWTAAAIPAQEIGIRQFQTLGFAARESAEKP